MLKIKKLKNHFIRNIPREIDTGVLYISMEYATAVHSCCCGCGERVVTPLSPPDWKMSFDGESVSLTPSVGNWNSACRSHYIIKQNVVVEAGSWNDDRIKEERKRDKLAKAHYYQSIAKSESEIQKDDNEIISIKSSDTTNLWGIVRRWLRKLIN